MDIGRHQQICKGVHHAKLISGRAKPSDTRPRLNFCLIFCPIFHRPIFHRPIFHCPIFHRRGDEGRDEGV